ncbi:hypothetical protein GCM10020000_46510 [Streptomyces olivoverticillatus]
MPSIMRGTTDNAPGNTVGDMNNSRTRQPPCNTTTDGLLLPVPDADGLPFWEFAARGELRIQACADCRELRFPPRPCCPHCQSFDSEWRRMSGRGRIWSYVLPHPPLLPAYAELAPYNVILVALADAPGIRLVGNLVTARDAPPQLRRPVPAAHRRSRQGRLRRARGGRRRAALGPGGGVSVRSEVRADGVALVTLDRPERHNAIDLEMAGQLRDVWQAFRLDDTVRAVVLTGAGDRAFCTGIDRSAQVPQPHSPYSTDDPLLTVGPKAADLWKPVIAAVGGMACGGAFYLLGEAEFVVASEDASFFDPHTSYGMVSAYESLYMAQLMPFGEAARLALMGTAERLSARRAYEIGLVSELTPPGEATDAALRAAATIAAWPTEPVQGTVRALWAARQAAQAHALALAPPPHRPRQPAT